jgi:hypothetical protein
MEVPSRADSTLESVASRLAALLTAGGGDLADTSGSGLVFENVLEIRPLERRNPPPDVWAVDGGQATVADARCVQLVVTRAASVRWKSGRTVEEHEGSLRAYLIGLGQERLSLAALGVPVDPMAAVDINLLRDWAEWETVAGCVEAAEPGGLVLVDGDLQPDWRIPSSWLASLLARSAQRSLGVVGVTKHSSLSRGGAPLLGQLETEAEARLGTRATWWVPVAHTRPDVHAETDAAGIQVIVARLDRDARFAFRVDLPAHLDPEPTLASLSALCDDAGFPGYPYPLSVADRLAACPGWLRDELWDEVQEVLDRLGVPLEVRERAFADRHRLMERY